MMTTLTRQPGGSVGVEVRGSDSPSTHLHIRAFMLLLFSLLLCSFVII